MYIGGIFYFFLPSRGIRPLSTNSVTSAFKDRQLLIARIMQWLPNIGSHIMAAMPSIIMQVFYRYVFGVQ